MKVVVDITCLGDGLKFQFENESDILVPASSIILRNEYSSQTFIDMSMAAMILSLHERLERLENKEGV